MVRDVNLRRYVPPVIAAALELDQIFRTEDIELSRLWDAASAYIDEQFLDTMTEYGVGRMEKMLGIQPYDTDTLVDRKFRISAWSNSDLPYTRRSLENMLRNLCGDDYTIDLSGFTMIVKIGLGVKKQYNEVVSMLERVVPANIQLDISLLYNTHRMLAPYTHAQLAAYTHEQLRSEVFE